MTSLLNSTLSLVFYLFFCWGRENGGGGGGGLWFRLILSLRNQLTQWSCTHCIMKLWAYEHFDSFEKIMRIKSWSFLRFKVTNNITAVHRWQPLNEVAANLGKQSHPRKKKIINDTSCFNTTSIQLYKEGKIIFWYFNYSMKFIHSSKTWQ